MVACIKFAVFVDTCYHFIKTAKGESFFCSLVIYLTCTSRDSRVGIVQHAPCESVGIIFVLLQQLCFFFLVSIKKTDRLDQLDGDATTNKDGCWLTHKASVKGALQFMPMFHNRFSS